MVLSEFERLMRQVKQALKTHKMNYTELAQKLGISESTLKKYLNGKDGSLGRLAEICDLLGMQISDLYELEGRWQAREIEFTDKQGQYLMEDEEALSVFFLLLYDGKTIAEVRELLNLSNARMKKILRDLDQLDLIKWLPSDKVPYLKEGILLWKDKGEFVEYIRQQWGRKLLDESIATRTSDPRTSMHLVYLKLSDKSHQSLQRELRELLEEYHRRSRQEMNFYGLRNLKGSKLCLSVTRGSFVGGV